MSNQISERAINAIVKGTDGMTFDDDGQIVTIESKAGMDLFRIRLLYTGLAFEMKFKTKQTRGINLLQSANQFFDRTFKNKREAFNFIHELLRVNKYEIMNICYMADCPGLKSNNFWNQAIGKYNISWETPNEIKTELVELCQDCFDFFSSKGKLDVL
jgi:hypothetical protein